MFDSAIQLQPGATGGAGASATRNRLINGQFDIWQRDTSFSGTTGPNGDYTADRWNVGGGDDGGVRTMNVNRAAFLSDQQEVPFSPQFYARIQTFATGGSGSEAGAFVQRIETGPHLFNGQKATASFWARSNSVGPHTIAVGLRQLFGTGGSSTIAFGGQEITLTQTWTFYSLTFDVLSIAGKNVVFGGAQAPSLRLRFITQVGALVTVQNGVPNPLDFQDELWLTNVQFESGDTASSYEDRFVGDELALCQRYYQQSYDEGVAAGTPSAAGRINWEANGGTGERSENFATIMRVAPTVSLFGFVAGVSGVADKTQGAPATTIITTTSSSKRGFTWDYGFTGNAVDFFIYAHQFTADAEIG